VVPLQGDAPERALAASRKRRRSRGVTDDEIDAWVAREEADA
jgi:hypothetical protein